MYKKYPDIIRTPGGPLVKQRLVECLEEVWKEIPGSFFRGLDESMLRRVAAVIKAGGWYTNTRDFLYFCVFMFMFHVCICLWNMSTSCNLSRGLGSARLHAEDLFHVTVHIYIVLTHRQRRAG